MPDPRMAGSALGSRDLEAHPTRRSKLELFYRRRYVDTKLWNPDFAKIAEAYDIPGVRVKNREEVIPAIQEAMDYPGPFVIDFLIEPEENIYPIVPPGESLARFFEPSRPEVLGA